MNLAEDVGQDREGKAQDLRCQLEIYSCVFGYLLHSH